MALGKIKLFFILYLKPSGETVPIAREDSSPHNGNSSRKKLIQQPVPKQAHFKIFVRYDKDQFCNLANKPFAEYDMKM